MENSSDSDQTRAFLDRIALGSNSALDQLLELHRPYLKRIVAKRIDPELQPRIDASDIVQETQAAIAQRIGDYLERRPTSFRLWIRREAIEKLVDQWRRHVGAQRRSVRREEPLANSSLAIARELAANDPSDAMNLQELQQQIRDIIDMLGDNDREILTLRHVDGLSSVEVAELIEIGPNTARQRYGRALRRLRQRLIASGIRLDDLAE